MARVGIPITVIDLLGNAKASATVSVRKRSDNSLATLYAAETGGTTVSNPLTTDANGRVAAWVDRGSYRHDVTASGLTGYSENWEAAPGSDGTIDSAWIAGSAFPLGFIAHVAYAGDPAGGSWLACDGRAISRTTYAAAYALIGNSYGAGDGSSTFNIPDLRGREILGAGTGTGGGASGGATTKPAGGFALTARSVGAWLGEEAHLLTPGETALVAHQHNMAVSNAGGVPPAQMLIDVGGGLIGIRGGQFQNTGGTNDTFQHAANASFDFGVYVAAVAAANAASAHNLINPALVANPVIRVA